MCNTTIVNNIIKKEVNDSKIYDKPSTTSTNPTISSEEINEEKHDIIEITQTADISYECMMMNIEESKECSVTFNFEVSENEVNSFYICKKVKSEE